MTQGTEGYDQFIQRFVEISQALNFHEVCKDFIDFLPSGNAQVLDVGAGAGQNAAALANLGFSVTAVEPMPAFLEASKKAYKSSSIQWLKGSLPQLSCLDRDDNQFDFVLIDGVWHHLDEAERQASVHKLSKIIKASGKCAISLRNGPPGMGTRVYPTDSTTTIELFRSCGFECVLSLNNQRSILPNKEDVTWSRIVMQKN